MTTEKKPDNVVFDEETQTYNAALQPYATDIGAPVVSTRDTVAWKNTIQAIAAVKNIP